MCTTEVSCPDDYFVLSWYVAISRYGTYASSFIIEDQSHNYFNITLVLGFGGNFINLMFAGHFTIDGKNTAVGMISFRLLLDNSDSSHMKFMIYNRLSLV